MYLAGAAYPLSGTGNVEGIAVIPQRDQKAWNTISDPTGCKFDKFLFIKNLKQVGLTRVDPQGRIIVFLDEGNPRFQIFGVSGQIKDKNGNPISGALVTVGGPNFADTPPVKTNACGTYHVLNLMDSDRKARTVEMTISTPTLGSQKLLVGLESYGQSFRDIVFDPQPILDQDPPIDENRPPPPPPIPTNVTTMIPDPIIIPIDVKVEPPIIKTEEAPYPAQIITILSPLDLQKTSATSGTIKGFVDDERVTTVYLAVGGVESQVPVVNQHFSFNATFVQGMNYIVARVSTSDDVPVTGYSPRVRVLVDSTLTGTGNVVGQVVDATTGRAVSGVQIRLNVTGEIVLTDVHGVFEFRDVPVGATTVEVVINNGEEASP